MRSLLNVQVDIGNRISFIRSISLDAFTLQHIERYWPLSGVCLIPFSTYVLF